MAKIITAIQMFDYDNGKQLVKVYYESGMERNYEKGKEPKTVSAWMKDNDYDWKELNQFEAEIVEEKEIERNPFGMVACMASVRTHVETFGEDPFEMLAEYEQRAKEDVFFNKTMIDAVRQYMEEHGIEEEPTEQEPTEEETPLKKLIVATVENAIDEGRMTEKSMHIGNKYMSWSKQYGAVLVVGDDGQYMTDWNTLTDEEKMAFIDAIEFKHVEDLTPTEEDTRTDIERHCDYIKEELEAVYNGELVADEDGRVDGIDYGLCEGDAVTMWDWFSCDDVYDIEYMIGSDGEYRGVRLMVACGGPNIYINTRRGEIEGYWWTDSATAWLPSEVCNAIDDVWSEYYSMLIG